MPSTGTMAPKRAQTYQHKYKYKSVSPSARQLVDEEAESSASGSKNSPGSTRTSPTTPLTKSTRYEPILFSTASNGYCIPRMYQIYEDGLFLNEHDKFTRTIIEERLILTGAFTWCQRFISYSPSTDAIGWR
uniref:Integrase core domain containing protein n=1 Tax=Solanum tuberosum TaxID=4113 RepID=M1DLX4_SOLTU